MKATDYYCKVKTFGFLCFGIAWLSATGLQAQTAPPKLWDKDFGGCGTDRLHAVQPTSDGGYILGGESSSDITASNKSENLKGFTDYWIVKTDAAGNKLWDKTIGGNNVDSFTALQQTADGGYILGGWSHSDRSGDKSDNEKNYGYSDFWVVKIDAFGNKVWDKTIGGHGNDYLECLQQTSDGGYILGGMSTSGISGDKSQPAVSSSGDYWVVKLDANGNKQWDKTFGDYYDDWLYSMQQTSDGGYILGGYSNTVRIASGPTGSRGGKDYWVIKLDANGSQTWNKKFGGSLDDKLQVVRQTADGGFILGGTSLSNAGNDKSQASKGGPDYWVVKLSANGMKQWDKTIGGCGADNLYSLKQASDGGYLLGGASTSTVCHDKSEAPRGGADYWVVKLNANGSKSWDKTIGGNSDDELVSLHQTANGDIILGGTSLSATGYDKTHTWQGDWDYWIVKLGGGVLGTSESETPQAMEIYQNQPNPFIHNTSLGFGLAQPGEVELLICNNLGQTVGKLRKKYAAGRHQVQWEEIVSNQNLKPGIYYCRFSAGTFRETTRMVKL